MFDYANELRSMTQGKGTFSMEFQCYRQVPRGLQGEILERAGAFVKGGGSLVYSTCTISKRENSDQALAMAEKSGLVIDDLGARAPQLADPHDSRFLQLMPDRDHTTGFFIARFTSGGV